MSVLTTCCLALAAVFSCSTHVTNGNFAPEDTPADASGGTSGTDGEDGAMGSLGLGGGGASGSTGGIGSLGSGGSTGSGGTVGGTGGSETTGTGGTAGTAGTGTGGSGGRGAGGTAIGGTGGTGGTGTAGRGGTGTGGTAGTAGTGAGGTGGTPIDCPGAQACTRTVYRIPNPVSGIIRSDPYLILSEYAQGPDTALTQQTSKSDDVRTTGAETYLFFVLSCPAGRQYGITWEGYADANSTHEVLVATADRSYVQMTDWPTARVPNLPTDRDVKHTVRGLVPDSLGNIFVRVQSSGGKLYTDWFAVGSCI